MAQRATVQVHGGSAKTLPLPAVFLTPIRPDVVKDVHVSMSKNSRQAYAVNEMSGMQHSAESWGTGRAVARIPRVSGGGTHAAGQGAFGNMCRHGRMFAPTKVWRRWHRRINVAQKRYAVASAVAASGVTALVLARGHRIDNIPEVPLVVSQEVCSGVSKTKQALALLKNLKVDQDLERVATSHRLRAGKGKMRNRRFTQRRGPLVVFSKSSELTHALRNIRGVDLARVDQLNLLDLAPGGHLGRFVLWTEDAFARLDEVFGDGVKTSTQKHGFVLPSGMMSNADLSRIVNSSEVQSVLRPKKKSERTMLKKNPLKNYGVMVRLNPYAAAQRRHEIKRRHPSEKHAAVVAKKKQDAKKKHAQFKKEHKELYAAMHSNTHNYEPKVLNKPAKQ